MDKRLYNKLSETLPQTRIVQKNWDLSQEIPDDIIELLKHSVIECPNSNRGRKMFNVHFIKNRDIINSIHDNLNEESEESVANLLVVFEKTKGIFTNDSAGDIFVVEGILNRGIGIAVGNLILTANLMGLSTGIVQDYMSDNIDNIIEILDLKDYPITMVGVGYKNQGVDSSRSHFDQNKKYTPYAKKPILVKEWS